MELKGLQILRNIDDVIESSGDLNVVCETIISLPIELLQPGKYQPRSSFNDQSLNELSESIQNQGIIQPLVVRKIDVEQYEIIAGERRCRAAEMAGLTHVPAIVRTISNEEALAIALIENIQREDLNAIEEAAAYQLLIHKFRLTHDEVAKRVGKKRATISNFLRLLELEPNVREHLMNDSLSMGHARALLSLDHEKQKNIAEKVIAEDLSVRAVERLIVAIKAGPIEEKIPSPLHNERCNEWLERLNQKIPAKVTLKINEAGKGKVTIDVGSHEEIEWLINHFV